MLESELECIYEILDFNCHPELIQSKRCSCLLRPTVDWANLHISTIRLDIFIRIVTQRFKLLPSLLCFALIIRFANLISWLADCKRRCHCKARAAMASGSIVRYDFGWS